MQFRVRTPQGKTSIIKLTGDTTIQDLQEAISKNLEINHEFTLSFGFPAKSVKLSDYTPDAKLSEAEDLKLNNESVQVIPVSTAKHTTPDQPSQPQPASSSTPSQSKSTALQTPSQPKSQSKAKPEPTPTTSLTSQDVPSIPLPSHSSTLTLRIMPDDNSCLFRAIAAATSPSTTAFTASSDDYTTQLRFRVAQYITSNSELYPRAILDNRSPASYANWIQQDTSWGGDIELDILSRVLGVEVWCAQISPFFVRKYNEASSPSSANSNPNSDSNSTSNSVSTSSGEFIVLLYSGIHYDTLALSPTADPDLILPAEFDIRKFNTADADWLLPATRRLCEQLASRGYMTDTSRFGVMCKVPGCGWVGKGEREAVEHARGTGHGDLEEIR